MTFVVRPGKYLIEKSRRRIIGVIAHVGTGGSVPKPAQDAVNAYARSLGESGSHVSKERETIRAGMRQMQGTWLIVSPAGLRWAMDAKGLTAALRNSGWNPGKEHLAALLDKNG